MNSFLSYSLDVEYNHTVNVYLQNNGTLKSQYKEYFYQFILESVSCLLCGYMGR